MPKERLRRPQRIEAIMGYILWLQSDPETVKESKKAIEADHADRSEGGGGFLYIFNNLVVTPTSAKFWFDQAYQEGLSTFLMNHIGADIRQREQKNQEIPEEIRSNFEGFIEEAALARSC